MRPDDTQFARLAAADPARLAGPSALEKRELADRVRQRVLHEGQRPAQHRSRPAIASLATVAGSALVVLAVGGLILVGHHRAPSPTANRPSHPQVVSGGAFAVLARPPSRRDRLPAVLIQRITRQPGHLPKLDLGRSALAISTSTRRDWVVPAAKQQLCVVQLNLMRGRRFGDGSFGEGCIGRRNAALYGLVGGESTTTFDAILPEHTSPVRVTFKDGSSLQLHANASGVITRHFSKPARFISYTGPTGLQVHATLYAGPTGLGLHLKRCGRHEQKPCSA